MAPMNGQTGLSRLWWFVLFLTSVSAAALIPLRNLVGLAFSEDLHSHVILVPFVSAYLIYLKTSKIHFDFKTSIFSGTVFLIAGLVLGGLGFHFGAALSETNRIAIWVGGYLSVVLGGAFLILGKEVLRPIAFPIFFLIFMIPLPDQLAELLEGILMATSAWVAQWFFGLAGIPVFKDGQFLQVPGIALEVARECSGIRSTWVLFISSFVIAYLFFNSTWRRLLLLVLIFPLGILRNGFRILVIGMLCVYIGPEMINSWIHRHGGPVFFAISLIPVFLLTWGLRRSEVGGESATVLKVRRRVTDTL
jgi:exosortase C (VPDSG-CTERM-specific)